MTRTSNIKPLYQIIFTLFIVGLALRFFELDLRPVHHDESLHGTYSRYNAVNPEIQYYKYDPMLHGPLLYTVTAWVFELFGISTFALRAVNATLGSLLVAAPLLFGRLLSPAAIIALSAIFAFSPSLLYWSRFAHHDYLVLAAYLMFGIGVFLLRSGGGILLCCLSIALQYSIKANVFVFIAQLVGFLVYEFLIARARGEASYLWKLGNNLKKRSSELLLGLASGALVFVALFSANFRYPEGILDGLYRKVFPYWLNQHKIQRLDGPFSYHLFTLSLYELPIVLVFIWALARELKLLKSAHKLILAAVTAASLVAAILIPSEAYQGWLKAHLKVSSWFDLCVCFVFATLAVILPLHHRIRREHELSFFAYFATATLWTYSFLGEKVPWLSIYPLLAIILYTVLLLDRRDFLSILVNREILWTKFLRFFLAGVISLVVVSVLETMIRADVDLLSRLQVSIIAWSALSIAILFTIEQFVRIKPVRLWIPVALLGGILSLHSAILTNYHYAGDPNELLAQVHTTKPMHRALTEMKTSLSNPLNVIDKRVLVAGNSVWPATWYLRDEPGYAFEAPVEDYDSFDTIILNENGTQEPEQMLSKLIPLQSWWVPDYSRMRIRDILGYYFNHKPWNPTGELRVKLFGKDSTIIADPPMSSADETEEEIPAEETEEEVVEDLTESPEE